MLGQDIYDSTCGIVGLGRIGLEIAERIKCFHAKTIVYSGHKPKPQGDKIGAKFVSFDDLLKMSDFVFIACPLTPETKFMFNSKTFALMKSNAVLVNISRGMVIDQDELIKVLENGRIFAAGLDVMTPEPLPTDSKLLSLPNCGKFAFVTTLIKIQIADTKWHNLSFVNYFQSRFTFFKIIPKNLQF